MFLLTCWLHRVVDGSFQLVPCLVHSTNENQLQTGWISPDMTSLRLGMPRPSALDDVKVSSLGLTCFLAKSKRCSSFFFVIHVSSVQTFFWVNVFHLAAYPIRARPREGTRSGPSSSRLQKEMFLFTFSVGKSQRL